MTTLLLLLTIGLIAGLVIIVSRVNWSRELNDLNKLTANRRKLYQPFVRL